ncbi:MAG TPA: TonB-dependent receptor plug domain-containing protein, partial [Flavisolibacter sp.]
MKLTVLLILFACLQVAARGYTQDKITLKLQAADLKKALASIEKVSDYHFLYNQALVANKPRVNIDVADADIATVLNILLSNTGIAYRMLENNLIVLKEESAGKTIAPDIRITGRVTGTANEPLAGVSVSVKGTSGGTTTDANGGYSITVPDESAVLVFSSVGFAQQEVPVGKLTTVNVTLSTSTSELNTVVVVGYGTQRKRDVTGSITSIKGEELARQPNTNPISSLQGKVAGLTIVNTGRAGASPTVRIRGVNSTSNTNPLYVVDGVFQTNIDYLNPGDIESIEVLRDPSSIAIFGLQGGNGVIIVTTRRAGKGQTRISFQSSVGIQKVINKIDVTDAAGFRKLYDTQLRNLNANPFDYTFYTGDTDWQNLIFRDAVINNNTLSISNSGEKSTSL